MLPSKPLLNLYFVLPIPFSLPHRNNIRFAHFSPKNKTRRAEFIAYSFFPRYLERIPPSPDGKGNKAARDRKRDRGRIEAKSNSPRARARAPSKRFRKWRSVYSAGPDMHSMSVHLLPALFEARRTCEYPCQNDPPHHPRLVKCALTPGHGEIIGNYG